MDLCSIASVSGGKDSTAMYLHMLEHEVPFRAVFADVGNEHPWTLEFLSTLAEKTGGPKIEKVQAQWTDAQFEKKRKHIDTVWRVKEGISDKVCDRAIAATKSSGNVFLDACILQSGFPAVKGRFCTDTLKVRPIRNQIYVPLWDQGYGVLSWQGVRREESHSRSGLDPIEKLAGKGWVWAVRPLLDWSIQDVWKQHKRHGVEPNRLYKHKAKRVGCWPCIFATQEELALIAAMTPYVIDRLREWEEIVNEVSKEGAATFFHAIDIPQFKALMKAWKATASVRPTGRYDEFGIELYEELPPKGPKPKANPREHGIDARVAYVQERIARRSPQKQDELIPLTNIIPDMSEDCGSWGVCE